MVFRGIAKTDLGRMGGGQAGDSKVAKTYKGLNKTNKKIFKGVIELKKMRFKVLIKLKKKRSSRG